MATTLPASFNYTSADCEDNVKCLKTHAPAKQTYTRTQTQTKQNSQPFAETGFSSSNVKIHVSSKNVKDNKNENDLSKHCEQQHHRQASFFGKKKQLKADNNAQIDRKRAQSVESAMSPKSPMKQLQMSFMNFYNKNHSNVNSSNINDNFNNENNKHIKQSQKLGNELKTLNPFAIRTVALFLKNNVFTLDRVTILVI